MTQYKIIQNKGVYALYNESGHLVVRSDLESILNLIDEMRKEEDLEVTFKKHE